MQRVCRSPSPVAVSCAGAALVLSIAISRGSLPAIGVIVLGLALVALGKGRAP